MRAPRPPLKVIPDSIQITTLREQLKRTENERDAEHEIAAGAMAQRDKAEAEVNRLSEQNRIIRESTASRIAALKVIIADNERQIADLRGYCRAQQERIEHDSPIVEVPQQPVVATRHQITDKTQSRENLREVSDYSRAVTGREPRKHWTEI